VAKDTIINKFEGVRPILSPDNKHMVNIYYNRENYTDFFKIIIYDLFSNTLISSVSLGQYIYKFRYSNDGKNIVAVNISKKGSVEIWDAFSGIKKYSYNIPLLAYDGVASSNDGKYVSTFSGQNLFLLGQRFTSIHEEKNSIFTNIYPNPSTGFVKIDFDLQNSELVVLRITDNAGAVINTINLGLLEPGNNSYRYDVSGLAGGVYYITLQGGIELGSYRFVKE
jgi:DNA-binding beta-propeller fold protein YncE